MTDDFIMFAGEVMMSQPVPVRKQYYELLSNYMLSKDSKDFLDVYEYTFKNIPSFTEDFKQYLTYLYK
jgi:aspartate aminotransferase-like enzyme